MYISRVVGVGVVVIGAFAACGLPSGDAHSPDRLAADPIFDVTIEGVDFEEDLEQIEGRDIGPDARPVSVTRRGTTRRSVTDLGAELRDIAVAHGWVLTRIRCGINEASISAVKGIEPNGAGLTLGLIGSATTTSVRIEAQASPSTQNTITVPPAFTGPDCLE